MKRIIIILFTAFFSLQVTAATAPSGYTIANIGQSATIIPGQSLMNLSTLTIKEAEKLLGRKLKLKEKIALKVLQWKIKKGYTYKKTEPGKKGKTAMILGIIALAALLIPYAFLASLPCAILAIVLGNQAKKANRRDGRAKAGIIMGWVTIGIIILAIIVLIAILSGPGLFSWG